MDVFVPADAKLMADVPQETAILDFLILLKKMYVEILAMILRHIFAFLKVKDTGMFAHPVEKFQFLFRRK